MNKQFNVYIMGNSDSNVLYTGITNDLIRRVFEHRNKIIKGFTSKYNITKLIYFESFDNPTSAITREKQIKGGSRDKKIALITKQNPNLVDLYETII